MDTARFSYAGRGGAQVQVVRVGQYYLRLDVLELCRRHGLHRSLGTHRHKDGGGHIAMVGVDHAEACL